MVGASIWRRSMRVQLVYGVDDADARAAAKGACVFVRQRS